MKYKSLLMIVLLHLTFSCKSVSQKIDMEENNYKYLVIDSSLISPLIETTNGLVLLIQSEKNESFRIRDKYFIVKIPRNVKRIKLAFHHIKAMPFFGGEYYSTQPEKDKGTVIFLFNNLFHDLDIETDPGEKKVVYLKLFFGESKWSSYSFTDIFFTIFPFPFLPPAYYILGLSPGFYYKIDLEKNIDKMLRIEDFRSVKIKDYGRLTEIDANGIFQFACNDYVTQGEIIYISDRQKIIGVGVITENKNKKCSSFILTNDFKIENKEFFIMHPEKR